jgi:hypothetical protein
MFRPALITSSTSSNWDAITGLENYSSMIIAELDVLKVQSLRTSRGSLLFNHSWEVWQKYLFMYIYVVHKPQATTGAK